MLNLNRTDAIANIAVKDLGIARKFYGDTLGLKQVEAEGDEAIVFESGSSKVQVYRSRYAGTNQATALSWNVDDAAATVKELKAKGVRFEHYDMPETKLEGDVHVGQEGKAAWFKDPDGNILSVQNRPEKPERS